METSDVGVTGAAAEAWALRAEGRNGGLQFGVSFNPLSELAWLTRLAYPAGPAMRDWGRPGPFLLYLD